MKKIILAVSFAVSLMTISACGNNPQKMETDAPEESTKKQYQCPMKCTEEIFDKPGQCPVCEMELEKITKS